MRRVGERTIRSFMGIYENKENLLSFENYYAGLITWFRENQGRFDKEVVGRHRIKQLMEIDEKSYIITNPDIVLKKEKERIEKLFPMREDTFLMVFSDLLWEMLAYNTHIRCLCHGLEGEYRCVALKMKEDMPRILAFECDNDLCGKLVDMNGNTIDGKVEIVFPATRMEVEKMVTHVGEWRGDAPGEMGNV